MLIPSCLELVKSLIYSGKEYIMKAKHMNIIIHIKYYLAFHLIKHTIIQYQAALNTSRHNLLILWLWTDRPVMKLPRPGPLNGCCNINWATNTFSPPMSARTRLGNPKSLTALVNNCKTVSDQLLSHAFKYIIRLLYPSIHPCTTIFHLHSTHISSYFYGLCIHLYVGNPENTPYQFVMPIHVV